MKKYNIGGLQQFSKIFALPMLGIVNEPKKIKYRERIEYGSVMINNEFRNYCIDFS